MRRAGYYLGFIVAKDLVAKFGLQEAVSWNYKEAQSKLSEYFEPYKNQK